MVKGVGETVVVIRSSKLKHVITLSHASIESCAVHDRWGSDGGTIAISGTEMGATSPSVGEPSWMPLCQASSY